MGEPRLSSPTGQILMADLKDLSNARSS